MFPGKQEHRQLEGGQALLLRPPVSNDLHTPPMGAWVATPARGSDDGGLAGR
jgi:hypothetical protein